MDQIAALLERHAAELHRAQSAHSFSWGKLLTIGAIVVVSAGLVVVTVGAAAPEVAAADSLLVGGEVGAMEAAAGAASTAASGTASGLLAAARAFSTLRGLVAFTRPALPWAIGFTGLDAVEQEVSSDRLDVGRLASEFGVSLLAPPILTRTSAALRAGALAERPVVIAATTHAAAAGMGGGSEAVREQLEHGKVSLSSVEVAAGEAGGLAVGGEALKHLAPRVWRPAAASTPCPKARRPSRRSACRAGRGIDRPPSTPWRTRSTPVSTRARSTVTRSRSTVARSTTTCRAGSSGAPRSCPRSTLSTPSRPAWSGHFAPTATSCCGQQRVR